MPQGLCLEGQSGFQGRVLCCSPFLCSPLHSPQLFPILVFSLGTALRTHLPCAYPLQAQLPYLGHFFPKLEVPSPDCPNPFSKIVARLPEAHPSIYLVPSSFR